MERDTQGLSRLRLGDILLARRLITREQLQEAVQVAQAENRRLGETLVKLSFLAESDLKSTLAAQLGLPYDPGPELAIDHEAAKLLSEQDATRLQALPLRQEGNILVVAVADPLNYQALESISVKTGRQARAVVVTETTLQRGLVKVFGLPSMDNKEEATASGGGPIYDIADPDDNPTVKLVNTLLAQAISRRASDIHIEALEDQVRVRYRVDGTLVETPPLPLSRHAAVISRLKVMAGMDIAERRLPQDGQVKLRQRQHRVDLRVNTVPAAHGERMVIRLLDRSQGLLGLNELGMPRQEHQHFRSMITKPNGLILVTGPTGSGKSTTLMATLVTLNQPGVNILTIEDPIEYHIRGIGQVQVNPKAGLTFSTGLRAFLRQDPDVMMVGEVRDSETADIAIRAALTGHLVLSTLHTNQAAGAVGRLVDMGIQPFLLASSLLGVVAQRLVRRLCPRCKQPYSVPHDSPLRYLLGFPQGPVTLYRAVGCGFCEQIGYHGRQAIFEVLPVTPEIRDLISAKASTTQIQERAVAEGSMRSLWLTGLEKALAGETSIEEVQKVALVEG